MKPTFLFGAIGLFSAHACFALAPVVTLTGPNPGIASSYLPATSTTVIYTVTNNVPKPLPLSVSGLSSPLTRTSVPQNCGDFLAPGPSTCQIGITIAPSAADASTTINQTLSIDYQDRAPLTSDINFDVSVIVLNNIVYVSDETGYVWQCGLTSGIELNGCTILKPTFTGSSWTEPLGLTIQAVNGISYGYVAGGSGSSVYQCGINLDGSFSTCGSMDTGTLIADIAFATSNGTLYAYVVDAQNPTISQCSLNLDGTFNTCNVTMSFDFPIALTFYSVNGTNFGYVSDGFESGSGTGYLYQCDINLDGSFGSCNPTPSTSPDWQAASSAFATIGAAQYAYVGDNTPAAGQVWRCNQLTDGSLEEGSCVQLANQGWGGPSGITIQTVSGNTYAYIADSSYYMDSGAGTGKVFECPILTDGTFGTCISTNPGWEAWDVAFP